MIGNPDLAANLPYLLARVAIDGQGISRLRRAIDRGVLSARDFNSIANGRVGGTPPDDLSALLTDVATLPGGVEIALDILHMHFYRDREEGRTRASSLIAVGVIVFVVVAVTAFLSLVFVVKFSTEQKDAWLIGTFTGIFAGQSRC